MSLASLLEAAQEPGADLQTLLPPPAAPDTANILMSEDDANSATPPPANAEPDLVAERPDSGGSAKVTAPEEKPAPASDAPKPEDKPAEQVEDGEDTEASAAAAAAQQAAKPTESPLASMVAEFRKNPDYAGLSTSDIMELAKDAIAKAGEPPAEEVGAGPSADFSSAAEQLQLAQERVDQLIEAGKDAGVTDYTAEMDQAVQERNRVQANFQSIFETEARAFDEQIITEFPELGEQSTVGKALSAAIDGRLAQVLAANPKALVESPDVTARIAREIAVSAGLIPLSKRPKADAQGPNNVSQPAAPPARVALPLPGNAQGSHAAAAKPVPGDAPAAQPSIQQLMQSRGLSFGQALKVMGGEEDQGPYSIR